MYIVRKCANDDCNNQVAWMAPPDAVCGECTIRDLYATEGIRALEVYLGNWAAFEALYGPN